MRKIHLLLGALLASLAATAVVVTIGSSSSHREAPLTSTDPTADDTDVFAFTAKEAPGALTVVANWVPFAVRRRTELLSLRRSCALLHQHRQHGRRRLRRPLPL